MPREAEPLSDQSTCTAPQCPRPAEVIVRGVDFDGTPYEERTCGSCGLYLLSAGAECGKPAEMTPLALDESRLGREEG